MKTTKYLGDQMMYDATKQVLSAERDGEAIVRTFWISRDGGDYLEEADLLDVWKSEPKRNEKMFVGKFNEDDLIEDIVQAFGLDVARGEKRQFQMTITVREIK